MNSPFIKQIRKFFIHVKRFPFALIFSNKTYLKIKYLKKKKRKLHLNSPMLLSEKLQWLKLYDRNPNYANLVDKYEVRKYIAETLGEEFLIPCLGVWNDFDEINFDELPNQFVLKCTHDSGSVVVCKDKKTLNIQALRKRFNNHLLINYFYSSLEWTYKHLKPRIIAETLMVDESGTDLKDYKFYCFNGEPKLINVIYDRFTPSGSKEFFYNPKWESLEIVSGRKVPDYSVMIEKPKKLEQMLEFARKLSANIPFVRIDFYLIPNATEKENIYFGEMTFYPVSGYERFTPSHWDKTLGDWLTLPPKNSHAKKK